MGICQTRGIEPVQPFHQGEPRPDGRSYQGSTDYGPQYTLVTTQAFFRPNARKYGSKTSQNQSLRSPSYQDHWKRMFQYYLARQIR